MHDFYNDRWYDYTGLTPEESLGLGWKNPFHPEDMPEAKKRWKHSLETGDPYSTEYRCRRKDGEWRWHLGRALPLRNPKTGVIEKWFGTCTDVHENIETKLAARRTREQLLSVLIHAHVTIFTVGLDHRITMLEGKYIWDATGENASREESGSKWYVGEDMTKVFRRLSSDLPEFQHAENPDFLSDFSSAVDAIISKRSSSVVVQHNNPTDGRSYRTRFLPEVRKKTKASIDDNETEGVIGIIMDVSTCQSFSFRLRALEHTCCIFQLWSPSSALPIFRH